MRAITGLLIAAGSLSLAYAYSAEPFEGWESLKGAVYLIHGGTLADRQPVTPKDHKLSILFDGQAAKQVFDSIGPDLPMTCSGEKGDRARDRGGIFCSYHVQDKGTKDGPYRCWIGLDLKTGASLGLVSC